MTKDTQVYEDGYREDSAGTRDQESLFDSGMEHLTRISDIEEAEEALYKSEARYRAIVEDQTEFITRFLPDGTLTFVNHATCRYLGKKPEELIGYSLFPFVYKEDRETLIKHITSLNREDSPAMAEYRIILPNEEVRWHQWTGRAIYDEEGGIIEYQAAGRDITEMKELQLQTEQMLCEMTKQSASLRNLIENMPAGVLLLDSNLNVIYANDAFMVYFDKSGNQNSSTCIDHLLPGAEECGIITLLNRALQTHKPVRVHDLRYEGVDEKITYWSGSMVPVRLQSGESIVSGIAMITIDITEEITARRRLGELAALAERRAADVENERTRLNTIIQSIPVPLVVCSKDWHIIAYNKAAARLGDKLGGKNQESLDWITKIDLFDNNSQQIDLMKNPMGRSMRGEVCKEEILHCRNTPNFVRTLSVNSAPLKNANGDISGVVAAFTDVTEHLRAQERVQEIYRREHAIAEKLQGCFLPKEFPEVVGFDIGQIYQPALDEALIGGDFYDIFELGDDEYGVVIADVAGKGLNAAVYTSMTKYMLRAYALAERSPEAVIAQLNEALSSCTPMEVFVTLIYGVLDTKNKKFTYTNAGHEQPLFYGKSQNKLEILDVTGRALALLPGSSYTSKIVELGKGDVLFFYTDGITDAGSGPDRLGQDNVLSLLGSNECNSAKELAEMMLNASMEFAGGKLGDDAAAIVIQALE